MNARLPFVIALLSTTTAFAGSPNPEPANERNLKPQLLRQTLASRFAPPPGFERIKAEPAGFAGWMRNLPLKPADSPVMLYDGRLKARQDVHAAVIDLDVGKKDLQQCADSIIRLRAEYLFHRGKAGEVAFQLTNGQKAAFSDWSAGRRPVVKNDRVTWRASSHRDDSHECFRRYLDFVFAYAGTRSLDRELKPIKQADVIEPGDVFIHPGSPGHAVIVVDVAIQAKTGRRLFLLAQGYMPAQDMHVLKNPNSAGLSPWYDANFGDTLITPEWTFQKDERKRF